MSQTRVLPVLPLDDAVVLPGMVVPLAISDPETRVAVDAARVAAGAPRRMRPRPASPADRPPPPTPPPTPPKSCSCRGWTANPPQWARSE